MSDPSALGAIGMEVNPLYGVDEEEDEVELQEREAPPPPVRRRPKAPKNDSLNRLYGGFAAVSVVSVYWCICVLVYCIVKYSI